MSPGSAIHVAQRSGQLASFAAAHDEDGERLVHFLQRLAEFEEFVAIVKQVTHLRSSHLPVSSFSTTFH